MMDLAKLESLIWERPPTGDCKNYVVGVGSYISFEVNPNTKDLDRSIVKGIIRMDVEMLHTFPRDRPLRLAEPEGPTVGDAIDELERLLA